MSEAIARHIVDLFSQPSFLLILGSGCQVWLCQHKEWSQVTDQSGRMYVSWKMTLLDLIEILFPHSNQTLTPCDSM